MSLELMNKKPQNIFLIADHLQKTYKNFVRTFQEFQNPVIQNWVVNQMEKKDLLYKDPLIELNFQFKKGATLEDFIQKEILKPDILKIFEIQPYRHQSDAIKKVCDERKNIIVSTGTGSGKSECFWIPIVNTCLEMRENQLGGIKAIVIFPMNALANSQYHKIARLLHGSGLKVGRYTGDTAYREEDAIRDLEKYHGRKPYDSELLSRDKIRETPPDILITNYVMLDLLLTRFEDRFLFPEKFKRFLKFLVLDEIHTYTGNAGGDVACLIRRLKEKTQTHGNIRCIGTSATIQDTKKTGKTASIIDFATKIFGEEFDSSSLITAEYVEQVLPEDDILTLPPMIDIAETDLLEFDGTFSSIIPIVEKLLGRSLTQDERTEKRLGELFYRHPTIIFLKNSLREEAKALRDLAKEYKGQLRKKHNLEDCLTELKSIFLLGTIARIIIQNEERPLLVPKLHVFFMQGQEMFSCLTRNGPHLSIVGDLKCKKCEYPAFPLYFCRNCGQEFYSLLEIDNEIYPRSFSTDEPGKMIYLTPKTKENQSWEIPDNWLDEKENIKSTYKDVLPIDTNYCPKCNKIDSDCSCLEKIDVWMNPHPLQLCPSCNIFYTKRKSEYAKLFSFSSAGRSSSTDVLTLETISKLSSEQKKLIIFTDSRQDTALQAEHLNEFQRRLNFRRYFYLTLKHIHENNLRVSDIEIGKTIFNFLEANKLLPDYQKETEEDEFSSAPPPIREFIDFLSFLTLSDVMKSEYFLDLTIDKLGLLRIEYDGLDKLIKHHYLTDNPFFQNLSEEERYDYLRGILDIFRWNGAIGNRAFIDTVNKFEDWKLKFKDDILFDIKSLAIIRRSFLIDKE